MGRCPSGLAAERGFGAKRFDTGESDASTIAIDRNIDVGSGDRAYPGSGVVGSAGIDGKRVGSSINENLRSVFGKDIAGYRNGPAVENTTCPETQEVCGQLGGPGCIKYAAGPQINRYLGRSCRIPTTVDGAGCSGGRNGYCASGNDNLAEDRDGSIAPSRKLNAVGRIGIEAYERPLADQQISLSPERTRTIGNAWRVQADG